MNNVEGGGVGKTIMTVLAVIIAMYVMIVVLLTYAVSKIFSSHRKYSKNIKR